MVILDLPHYSKFPMIAHSLPSICFGRDSLFLFWSLCTKLQRMDPTLTFKLVFQ